MITLITAVCLFTTGIKEEDAGTYFCGKVKANAVEFGSGTRLIYQAETIDHQSVTEMVIKTGESSCVYKLPKRNLSLSDAGTYYCAVAACGRIVFRNQTKVTVEENSSGIIITLTTLNVISVIVIMVLVGVLIKNQRKGASNSHPSHIDQAEDTEVLNYAALKFVKKPPTSRPPRVKENPVLYSQVKHS
ncbi:hypothetical protein MHYP_G00007900 [Metynnis hypsauchen]